MEKSRSDQESEYATNLQIELNAAALKLKLYPIGHKYEPSPARRAITERTARLEEEYRVMMARRAEETARRDEEMARRDEERRVEIELLKAEFEAYRSEIEARRSEIEARRSKIEAKDK